MLFPAHPRTRAAIEREGLRLAPEVELLPPLGYLEMASLASQARVILTDSGGLQKEAYWYGVPCRDDAAVDRVGRHARRGRERPRRRRPGARSPRPRAAARFPENAPPLYGDGRASVAIAHTLARLSRS